jgi:3-deoxy-D-manno-octulosonic-acid transferase
VGEVLSAIPFVDGLTERFPKESIVFSVSTHTGFQIATERLTGQVTEIFFFPYDFIVSVKRAANKIAPDLMVIIETDIWPNFLFELKKRSVPVLLANARLSNRSFAGYRRLSFFISNILEVFRKIFVQSPEDARRFVRLGVPEKRLRVSGNFKFDRTYDPPAEAEFERLKQLMHIKPLQKILLAGSTHKGEETVILKAFTLLKEKYPDLLLIIAPRNPQRAVTVLRLSASAGWKSSLWKSLNPEGHEKPFDVIVVDAIGLLTRLYALSDIAYVGGSMVNAGGHNPLEPAAFSKPILFGPDMSDFDEISRMLIEAGGAMRVSSADDVYHGAALLIGDNQKARNVGRAAFGVFGANKGAVDIVLEEVDTCLSKTRNRA